MRDSISHLYMKSQKSTILMRILPSKTVATFIVNRTIIIFSAIILRKNRLTNISSFIISVTLLFLSMHFLPLPKKILNMLSISSLTYPINRNIYLIYFLRIGLVFIVIILILRLMSNLELLKL